MDSALDATDPESGRAAGDPESARQQTTPRARSEEQVKQNTNADRLLYSFPAG